MILVISRRDGDTKWDLHRGLRAFATNGCGQSNALDLVLTALSEARRNPPSAEQWVVDLNNLEHMKPVGRNYMLMDEIMDTPDLDDDEELAFDLYGPNPVAAVLLASVRKLGESLFAYTHSTDAMMEAHDRVCAIKSESDFDRSLVIDRAWDGIGDWAA